MHDMMLSVSYESLGKILAQLQDAPEIRGSQTLAERVRNAVSFHRQISVEMQASQQEHEMLKQKLSEMTRDPSERVCGQASLRDFGKYEEMRQQGAPPQQVYLATRNDGLDRVESIAALRQLFQFSLPEAQAVISQAEAQFRQHAA